MRFYRASGQAPDHKPVVRITPFVVNVDSIQLKIPYEAYAMSPVHIDSTPKEWVLITWHKTKKRLWSFNPTDVSYTDDINTPTWTSNELNKQQEKNIPLDIIRRYDDLIVQIKKVFPKIRSNIRLDESSITSVVDRDNEMFENFLYNARLFSPWILRIEFDDDDKASSMSMVSIGRVLADMFDGKNDLQISYSCDNAKYRVVRIRCSAFDVTPTTTPIETPKPIDILS
jgi:hypothetical protein